MKTEVKYKNHTATENTTEERKQKISTSEKLGFPKGTY